MNTKKTSTTHPLRTIMLRFDTTLTAPDFETLALEYYHEIHDRTWETRQRIKQARTPLPSFGFQLEEVEELFQQGQGKFRHLEMMDPDNPEKNTVHVQLKAVLTNIKNILEDFVPELVDAASDYYAYEDYIVAYEQWMNEVAFPQFDKIFANYQACSLDMVSFDRDLDDFKGALHFVKQQEGRYFEAMNELIERYSDLNEEIGNLFEQAEAFDSNLLV
ncbi:hypothetical protein C4F40_07505 [Sphingobacterium sp. Ka21]|uniref:Uncharacterized protein n=2 Tax=Sphingobacterium pedocola TaxID=2082722 RepID=A0ABR9T5F0_9SPHI|nr:hypothetical protein [Sphingobacterium pedocola]